MELSQSPSLVFFTIGNTYTGPTSDAPDQKLGSLNDFDVPFIRNSVEIMRLLAGGLIIGDTVHVGPVVAPLELGIPAADSIMSREVLDRTSGTPIVKVCKQFKAVTLGAVSVDLDDGVFPNRNETLKVYVVARQTAGGVGAVGDGASYEYTVRVRNVAGVVTLFNLQNDYSSTDDAGLTVAFSVAGNNVRITVNGVAGRDMVWGVRTEALQV